MKGLITLSLCLALITGCITVQEYVVDYDYSYKGKFGRYNSFTFVSRKGLDDTPYNDLIENAIIARLRSQGYQRTEKKPNLLISYKVFLEDFDLNTYEQPHLVNWLREVGWAPKVVLKEEELEELEQLEEDEELSEETYEERQERLAQQYNAFKCESVEGTMYIVLYDPKLRKSVWQGYASGVFGNENFDNRKSVKKAVSKILDEYQLLARGYKNYNQ